MRRVAAILLVIVLLAPNVGAQPYPPPAPPYPPSRPQTVPRAYPPPVVVNPNPPPLSPFMRAVYAPFYAAGLVVRYGAYYLIAAPLEVFGRAVAFGVEGGVDRPPAREPDSSGDDL